LKVEKIGFMVACSGIFLFCIILINNGFLA
jgi:hypothetical protein